MKTICNEINEVLENFELNKSKIYTDDWEIKTESGKWSKKEILGHLIDSAANNHQRFVRAQYENIPEISYNQNDWVNIQNYSNASVENLTTLFLLSNKHLIYVINNIPEVNYQKKCNINKEDLVTLEWLVKDYLRHLKHHLAQII